MRIRFLSGVRSSSSKTLGAWLSFVVCIPLLVMAGAPATDIGDATLAPDLARERRMAAEIRDAILDGEPLSLKSDDDQRFLGIYTEAVNAGSGTAVILHGRGFHPDWMNVVQPLRVGLTEHGWHTLSIQMPVLNKQAKYYDYVKIFDSAIPRIESAIAAARAAADGPVILVAHSCATHMAQHWVRARGAAAVAQIDAFVGIGMGATDYGQPMRVPFALDAIGVPILDVYAEHDFPAVKRLAPERLAAMRHGGNPKNAQQMIADAEHYFVDRGDALVEKVANWLETL